VINSLIIIILSAHFKEKGKMSICATIKRKVKQSPYRAGVAQKVPGS